MVQEKSAFVSREDAARLAQAVRTVDVAVPLLPSGMETCIGEGRGVGDVRMIGVCRGLV